jgi:hypothetical protein
MAMASVFIGSWKSPIPAADQSDSGGRSSSIPARCRAVAGTE